MSKYKITEIEHPKYPWLHRIQALIDVNEKVPEGTLGGFVENENNLSQEGTCWIYDDAICCENGEVKEEAALYDGSLVRGYAVASPGVTDLKITQQSGTCTGVVKDATGETVIGASVVVKGTTNGTITDFDGNFTLNDVKNGDVIQISFVGYITQEMKWNGTPLNVILKDDTQTLDEVVVVGYGGSQKRAALTTAITKMDDQVLKKAAYSNVGQSLQGSVSGLRVVNTTGQPGSSPNITLRGGATITGDNSAALIIVDGIVDRKSVV